jgi:hypothetical protein
MEGKGEAPEFDLPEFTFCKVCMSYYTLMLYVLFLDAETRFVEIKPRQSKKQAFFMNRITAHNTDTVRLFRL